MPQSEYTKGFEHAVRNIVAAIEKQAREEEHSDRRLGLRVALNTAKSYHGWMDNKETA